MRTNCPYTGKIRHDTPERAKAHLRRLARHHGVPDTSFRVYVCRCGKYHVAHTRLIDRLRSVRRQGPGGKA